MIHTIKYDQRRGFSSYLLLLSVILHLLFFISISVSLVLPEEKSREHYVSSYVYQPPISSSLYQQNPSKVNTPKLQAPKKSPLPHIQEQKIASRSVSLPQKDISVLTGSENESVMAMSLNTLKQNQIKNTMEEVKDEEPLLLIGDNTLETDPFIKIIGRVLSANFIFPETEGRLGIKGSVLVALVIHPEGYFSDIHILRASDTQNFNNAALYAINKAPRAIGVDRFLSKPKRIVIRFMFI